MSNLMPIQHPAPRQAWKRLNGKAPRELQDWGQVVTRLANQEWATDIRQIPSAVIEAGVFKHVPYTSFRCWSVTRRQACREWNRAAIGALTAAAKFGLLSESFTSFPVLTALPSD